MSEKDHGNEAEIEHAADSHQKSRRQVLDKRLLGWGITAVSGYAATWAGYGLSLIKGSAVAVAAAPVLWWAGAAVGVVGAIGAAVNIISRIRKKNR